MSESEGILQIECTEQERKLIRKFKQKIFKELFEMAEIAKYDRPNRQIHEDSLKAKRDWKNSLDTSFEKGKLEGNLRVKAFYF